MKAKMYEFRGKMEIKLSDDSFYVPKKNESKEDFIARVKQIVADDHLDENFELVEITKEDVELNDDATLLEAFEVAEGLQKKVIQDVLADRKLVEGIKVPKVKVAPKTVEEMKSSEHYLESEANVGKYVKFSPFKSEEVYEGKIAGVALNKTNTIVYYTVVEKNGKRRCCAVKNESIEFIDAPIQEAVEPAKAKPAKKAKKAKVEETETETVATDVNGDAPEAAGDDLM